MPRSAPTARKSPRRKRAPDISTFPNAVRYLMERTDIERMRVVRYDDKTFTLDRMRALMEALGNPQDQVRLVHVAGTVGKGSTVEMIASMLEGCGYAVGRYTSPHLIEVRERVAINGQPIGRSEFTDLMREVAQVVAKNETQRRPR